MKLLVMSCNFLSNQCSFILDKNPPPNLLILILELTSSLLTTSGSYTFSLSIWLFPFFFASTHTHILTHLFPSGFFFFSENWVILSSLKLLIIFYCHQWCKYDFNLYWMNNIINIALKIEKYKNQQFLFVQI